MRLNVLPFFVRYVNFFNNESLPVQISFYVYRWRYIIPNDVTYNFVYNFEILSFLKARVIVVFVLPAIALSI